MSRIGKKEIKLSENTEATLNSGNLSIKGPKGTLERRFIPDITILIEDKIVKLIPNKNNKETKSLWGTYGSHIKNMIEGVTNGFEKKIILEGVGYKSQVDKDKMILALGFSHPVEILIPKDLSVKAEKNLITISGIDKELVGSFSAKIRDLKRAEPYKGKGFRYQNEIVRRKQGKKSV